MSDDCSLRSMPNDAPHRRIIFNHRLNLILIPNVHRMLKVGQPSIPHNTRIHKDPCRQTPYSRQYLGRHRRRILSYIHSLRFYQRRHCCKEIMKYPIRSQPANLARLVSPVLNTTLYTPGTEKLFKGDGEEGGYLGIEGGDEFVGIVGFGGCGREVCDDRGDEEMMA